ncbi:GH32 C-terminal domain-containing protein [Pseudarthrobacter sp. S3]|uniref:GH32 C-terminal domain-containing protein n=1 Tax=unclassified Pseudarthrobacter TaxID=2647000 RepID=UPI003CF2923C
MLTLRIVVDHCMVEVFAQGGKAVLTDLVFPRVGSRVRPCLPRAARPSSGNWLSPQPG